MFYVRGKMNEDVSVEIDINDDNVFCRCPRCGKEVPVDLSDFAGDEEFNLYGSAVLCKDCSRRLMEERQE